VRDVASETAKTAPSAGQGRIRLTISPEAEKYVRRDAPVEVRRMASRGALPLEPVELATVLFALLHDSDDQVKQQARASLEGLPESVRTVVLSGPSHPALLSYLARAHEDSEACSEQIALNPAADDATIAFLAALPHRRVVDIISQNQERMLRCEEIVDALGSNPLTGRAVIERILSFLGMDTQEASATEDEPAELSDEEAQAAVLAAIGDEFADVAGLLASEGEEEEEDEATLDNLFAAIQKMNVMQKIKLARVGGKEARSILIRDRNKVVSTAVISSPKITDSEVITIAQSRGVSDEILRLISINRDWTRNYKVKVALVTNPKTPQPVAIKFLNYMQDKDLRGIMKSRDVPSAISTHARRILTKKGKI